MLPTLDQLRKKNSEFNDFARLYLYKTYNVKWFRVDSLKHNFAYQLQQGLAQAMNKNFRLPAIILILFSDAQVDTALNVIKDRQEANRWVSTFIKEIAMETYYRKGVILTKAVKENAPRIYMVKTPSKPRNMYHDIDLRRRFNDILNDVSSRTTVGTISIKKINPEDNSIFSRDGTLNHKGMAMYWIGLDNIIEIIDTEDKVKTTRNILDRVNKRKKENTADKISSVGTTYYATNNYKRQAWQPRNEDNRSDRDGCFNNRPSYQKDKYGRNQRR